MNTCAHALFSLAVLTAGLELGTIEAGSAEAAGAGVDQPANQGSTSLGFTADDQGQFHFDTGILRGLLRAGGKSLGLQSLVHVPTGIVLDRSNGLMSYYRVFTSGTRYGVGAWDWPSTAKLLDNGAVEVAWPAAAGRPFTMKAIYRWSNAATLEVETLVSAQSDLRRLEVFLASYFNTGFTNSLVYVAQNPEAGGQPGFLPARKKYGDWLMFPRDAAAVTLITDGRWKLEPNPVNWILQPAFKVPLGVRRDPRSGLTAVLMSPTDDCFAIATPDESEGHYSMYFSLFGRDVKAGETARARSRLWIAQAATEQRMVEAYEAYRKAQDNP